jgi:hypothetical protein
MPPDEIDSLNAESLKGLVLSLLGKIDDLHEHNKARLARIDELLARIAELEGRAGKPPKDADKLIGAAIARAEGRRRRRIRQEEPQRAPRRDARTLPQPRRHPQYLHRGSAHPRSRRGEHYLARCISGVAIFPRRGSERALAESFAKGGCRM